MIVKFFVVFINFVFIFFILFGSSFWFNFYLNYYGSFKVLYFDFGEEKRGF